MRRVSKKKKKTTAVSIFSFFSKRLRRFSFCIQCPGGIRKCAPQVGLGPGIPGVRQCRIKPRGENAKIGYATATPSPLKFLHEIFFFFLYIQIRVTILLRVFFVFFGFFF